MKRTPGPHHPSKSKRLRKSGGQIICKPPVCNSPALRGWIGIPATSPPEISTVQYFGAPSKMTPWWERSELEIAYEPLREGEIRLIKFDDITSSSHDSDYHIQHVNINNPPPYCALSYRWPNGKELDEPLKFKGHWLDIRGGPLTAVRSYLSNVNAADRHLPFWIDQFCIQQSNLEEMGQQVSLMREIYSKASATIIFLGVPRGSESEHHFRSAFDYLRTVSHESSFQGRPEKLGEFTKEQSVGTVSALATILSAPWFSRTWVVQEAILSRNAVVLCGRHIEDMLQLCMALKRFDDMGFLRQLFRDFHRPEHPWQRGFQKVRLFYHLKLSYVRSESFPTACIPGNAMISLLARCRPLEATDRRDKIFALSGICRTVDLPNVDYTLSEADVYQTTAVRSLHEGHRHHSNMLAGGEEPISCPWNDLCLLALVNADSETIPSPSWVPDWTLPLTYNDLWFENEEWVGAGFHASGATSPHIEVPSHSPKTLIIRGKVCSVVASVGEDSIQTRIFYETDLDECGFDDQWWPVSRGSREGSLNQGRRLPEWILRAGEYLRMYTDDVSLREERIARTLCAGARVGTASGLNSEQLAVYWKAYQRHAPRLLGIEGELHFSRQEDDINTGSQERDQWAFRKLLGLVGIPCRGRRLFVTADGHLGLGPGRMKEGDVVSVLFGAHWPFVLRPHGDAFLLVGYCYVDGMMYGEMVERDDVPANDICLV